jgi:hypothetical protein
MFALLAKQSLQEKVRGEQRVLPLINKWQNPKPNQALTKHQPLALEAEISDSILSEISGSQILFFRLDTKFYHE